MLFTQIEFIVLFAIVYVCLLVIHNHTFKKRFLLLVSYYFYGYWDYRFLGLLLACTAINYWLSRIISASNDHRRRKSYLVLAVVVNLGLLGFFKYFNFFVKSANAILLPLGLSCSTLNIILPVGISFFTFQALSYTIDIYRGHIKLCRNFLDFALFVSFFPQLVAGPIVRASEFLPQLQESRQLSWLRFYHGFEQFVFGLFKKVFIANRLAYFVDYVFDNAVVFDSLTIWLASLGYTIQIYCDFSGYSDMAIGTARALGFDFNKNFNLPYIAKNIEEFWHRWHISLSTWLRDYLYIPLGGNRKGERRTYVNIFITMLLGGLWHGAAWTFVFWGCWHGIALLSNKAFHKWQQGRRSTIRIPSVISWLLTMLVVVIGWIFFRASTFSQAKLIIKKMMLFEVGIGWYHPFVVSIIVVMIIYHIFRSANYRRFIVLEPSSVYTPIVLFTMIWLVIIYSPRGFHPFIYFQF